MTRAIPLALAALAACAVWVVWVLAHAPVDTEPCDLCADLRVVPPTRSPHHHVYRTPSPTRPDPSLTERTPKETP